MSITETSLEEEKIYQPAIVISSSSGFKQKYVTVKNKRKSQHRLDCKIDILSNLVSLLVNTCSREDEVAEGVDDGAGL